MAGKYVYVVHYPETGDAEDSWFCVYPTKALAMADAGRVALKQPQRRIKYVSYAKSIEYDFGEEEDDDNTIVVVQKPYHYHGA